MATRAIGLDIGTSSVRAAQVSFDKRGAVLQRFGSVALPPGAVVQGEVQSAEAVATALKALWSSARFDTRRVAVGVASRRVVVRQVDLPEMPRDELKSALPFLVQDFIPMPVDAALLDMHVLEQVTGPTGTPLLRGLLVAASREMVDQTLEAVRLAGLKPVSVDLTPFAVLRALGQTEAPLDSLGDAEVLIDIGAAVTNIVVHQGGVPRFVRILLMGGAQATEAIGQRLGIGYDEAEALKLRLSEGASLTSSAEETAASVLDATSDLLCEEIRGSLGYFATAHSTTRLSRIALTGGGARMTGIQQSLARDTNLPVVQRSPLPALRLGRHAGRAEAASESTAVPVGLALAVA